eukprot:TRINITY_DN28967_c0_g1_i1.p1 TRINITY_DN28967_c0_g1~~TRINITY_DN28967_c0_g1_i1.p1  ORF type:complete len:436 (+),score=82.11 TRINITY_DN28967_c0_g1_i1:25-1308(+)
MPLRLGSALQDMLATDGHSMLSDIQPRCRGTQSRSSAANFEPLASAAVPRIAKRSSKRHLTSFLPKCLCPVQGHCVPGFQCPKGEHVDPSACFFSIKVQYNKDEEYAECLKEKESEPEKECRLKMLADIFPWRFWFPPFVEWDHPIVVAVKPGSPAQAGGVRPGMELIAIDGNQGSWRRSGPYEWLSELDWRGEDKIAEAKLEREEAEEASKAASSNEPPGTSAMSGAVPPESIEGLPEPPKPEVPPATQATPLPSSSDREVPCTAEGGGSCKDLKALRASGGHELTFKVSNPAWLFWKIQGSACKHFQETCCAMASSRKHPEDLFAVKCATAEHCKGQENCNQMPGKPGICQYQQFELPGDYDEKAEKENEKEEQADKEEDQEVQEEKAEEAEEDGEPLPEVEKSPEAETAPEAEKSPEDEEVTVA